MQFQIAQKANSTLNCEKKYHTVERRNQSNLRLSFNSFIYDISTRNIGNVEDVQATYGDYLNLSETGAGSIRVNQELLW